MDLLEKLHHGLRKVLVVRGVKSRTGQVGGHGVHYYELSGKGHGPPVLLVHGLGGSANGFYKTFFLLSRRFSRVFAVDLPGSGFSPLPPAGPLAVRACVPVLADFLREKVREPALVVGNSLGGGMAATLAHGHPDLVRALVLISPAGAQVSEEKTQALLRSFDVKTTGQARALTRRLFHRAPIGALLLASQLGKLYASPAVRAVLAEVGPKDALAPELLASLRMPTLLIWGQSEKLLPYDGVEYFRAHLPSHATVEVVPRFGHVPQMERPAELVRHLVRFSDRHGL